METPEGEIQKIKSSIDRLRQLIKNVRGKGQLENANRYEKYLESIMDNHKIKILYMEKANCYKCRFRKQLPGDSHSRCDFIREASGNHQDSQLLELEIAAGTKEMLINKQPITVFNKAGIEKGYVIWPINYDPIWLEKCQIWDLQKTQLNKE